MNYVFLVPRKAWVRSDSEGYGGAFFLDIYTIDKLEGKMCWDFEKKWYQVNENDDGEGKSHWESLKV